MLNVEQSALLLQKGVVEMWNNCRWPVRVKYEGIKGGL